MKYVIGVIAWLFSDLKDKIVYSMLAYTSGHTFFWGYSS